MVCTVRYEQEDNPDNGRQILETVMMRRDRLNGKLKAQASSRFSPEEGERLSAYIGRMVMMAMGARAGFELTRSAETYLHEHADPTDLYR